MENPKEAAVVVRIDLKTDKETVDKYIKKAEEMVIKPNGKAMKFVELYNRLYDFYNKMLDIWDCDVNIKYKVDGDDRFHYVSLKTVRLEKQTEKTIGGKSIVNLYINEE